MSDELREEAERLVRQVGSVDPEHFWTVAQAALRKVAARERDKTAAIYKEDVASLEKRCARCPDPNVGLERHEHDGRDGPHWHHYLDPGDGLADDCPQEHVLERAYQLGAARERERCASLYIGEAPVHFGGDEANGWDCGVGDFRDAIRALSRKGDDA